MDAVLDSVLKDVDDMIERDVRPQQQIYTANTLSGVYGYYYPASNVFQPLQQDLGNSSSMMKESSPTSSVTPNPPSSISCSYFQQASPSVVYKWPKNGKVEMKDHVFISKDATYRLSQYLISENWGRDNVLLYKYVDYIFRCQSFADQIIEVQSQDVHCLIFHTGLQRRSDFEYLWCVLHPNSISKTHKNKQKWRVQFGNIEDTFLTQNEMVQSFGALNIRLYQQLPRRTLFFRSIQETIYQPSFAIQVSWEERLITNQDRIYKVIGNSAFFDAARKHLKLTALCVAFRNALARSRLMAARNPTLAVPQGFVDTKRCNYRMELLLPLVIDFNRTHYRFALAIGESLERRRTYDVKSVLTVSMGYANARLIGMVHSPWLKDMSNTY